MLALWDHIKLRVNIEGTTSQWVRQNPFWNYDGRKLRLKVCVNVVQTCKERISNHIGPITLVCVVSKLAPPTYLSGAFISPRHALASRLGLFSVSGQTGSYHTSQVCSCLLWTHASSSLLDLSPHWELELLQQVGTLLTWVAVSQSKQRGHSALGQPGSLSVFACKTFMSMHWPHSSESEKTHRWLLSASFRAVSKILCYETGRTRCEAQCCD